MERTDTLEIFVAVVSENGFSAASRLLGIPLPTVSRRIAKLEERLGVQLLTRTTRSLSLTEAGKRYFSGATQILHDIRHLDQEVVADHTILRGELTLASPVEFGRKLLSPIISKFLKEHSSVSIQHVLINPMFDYTEKGIDLGVRIGPLKDSGMKSIGLGEIRVVLCASIDYLEKHGAPKRLKDLTRHKCIAYTPFGRQPEWGVGGSGNTLEKLEINPVYRANDIDAVRDLVEIGSGIGWLHSYQISEALASGRVKILLSKFEVPNRPVNFLYPEMQFVPQKTRKFLETAVPELRTAISETQRIAAASHW